MSAKEIAEAKKCVLTTSDWDTFQIIIRTCLSQTGPLKNMGSIKEYLPDIQHDFKKQKRSHAISQ